MIIDFKKQKKPISPMFFINKIKIIVPFILFLIVSFFFFLDKPFAFFSRSSLCFLYDPFLLISRLCNPLFALLVFPFLFFCTRFVLKAEKNSRKFLFLSLSLPLSILCSETLEVVVGRSNPYWLFLHGEMILRFFQWNPSFHSFPSSISCTIGTLAASFACLYPRFSLVFLIVGLILGLSPAILTLCFLSDALAGLWIGMTLSTLVFKIMKKEVTF